MSRIVLLHLTDAQVDTLTVARTREPAGDMVVVHPEESALVRRLARMADIQNVATPPAPQPEDLVIRGGAAEAPILREWEKLGVPIVSPEEFNRGEKPTPPKPEPAAVEPSPPEALRPEAPRPEPADRGSGNGAGLDLLVSPAASLDYLLTATLGEASSATLWWDGRAGVWTPWAGTVSGLASRERPPEGLSWETAWGAFVLTGSGLERVSPHLEALRRISEDMALRDLMHFQTLFREHSALERSPSPGDVGPWLESAAVVLKPSAAMAWERNESRWQLAAAVGGGIVFSGSLKMDEGLLSASFGNSQGWAESRWGDRLRVYWQFSEDNSRWPLYLKRLTEGEPPRA